MSCIRNRLCQLGSLLVRRNCAPGFVTPSQNYVHHMHSRVKMVNLLPSAIQQSTFHLCPSLSYQQIRHYAKKGRVKQSGKAKGKHKMQLTEEEANDITDFSKLKEEMIHAVENMKQGYTINLSLRTSAGAFDRLMVETPSGRFHLSQLAQISQKNPQLVVINMVSSPQFIPNVKEAISKSNMNLNPQQEGTSLFVPVPKVTREHREGLSKSAKLLCEKTKEKLRDIQKKGLKKLDQQKGNSPEDVVLSVKDLIQSTTHHYIEEAEKIMHAKQKELLGK